jgi:hypothetical protein
MMIYSLLSVKRNQEELNDLLNQLKGISGGSLSSVSYATITAVVSEINGNHLIADQSNAVEYARIIEALAQQFTLLPMRFGSMMETNDAITKMMERNYLEIQQNLQKVDNKVEYGLKIFCDSGKLREKIKASYELNTQSSIKTTSQIINSIYRDYVDKKLAEHRLEDLLLTFVDSVIAGITGSLNRLKAICKFRKMITETTIIDAVFLLDKKNERSLVHLIDDFKNQFNELDFVLTGPWPPYNFVETTIK